MATVLPSIVTTACTNTLALVIKASLAASASSISERPLLDAELALFGERDYRLAGAARQDLAAILPRHQHIILVRMKADDEPPSGHLAVLDHPGLAGAGFRRRLFANTCANSATLLMRAWSSGGRAR